MSRGSWKAMGMLMGDEEGEEGAMRGLVHQNG